MNNGIVSCLGFKDLFGGQGALKAVLQFKVDSKRFHFEPNRQRVWHPVREGTTFSGLAREAPLTQRFPRIPRHRLEFRHHFLVPIVKNCFTLKSKIELEKREHAQ